MQFTDTSLTIDNWPLTIDHYSPPNPDSLRLALLDVAIERARLEARKSAFLNRLIPDVAFGASFSLSRLAFIDPSSTQPLIWPRDSYRLTLSLSISGIFDGSAHEQALLNVREALLRKEVVRMEQQGTRAKLDAEIHSLKLQLEELRQEYRMAESILQFRKMQFEAGKLDFENLMQAELRLLRLHASVTQLTFRLAQYGRRPE